MSQPSILGPAAALAIMSFVSPLHASALRACERDPSKPFTLTLMHTNDLHSTFVGADHNAYFTEVTNDGDPVRGHYGRLASLIQQIRRQKELDGEPSLLVDAGDFYGGTLFHILGPNPASAHAPELSFFAYTGYDAVTIGNHEFDAGFDGFLNMLAKNRSLGLNVQIVGSNARFPADYDRGGYTDLLDQIQPFLVKEVRQDDQCLRVGILGLLGPDGSELSRTNRQPAAFVGFDDGEREKRLDALVQHIQDGVDDLRVHHGVDLVVVVMHGGDPEDRELARALSGIDIIVAGHRHEAYAEPVLENGVYLVQAGSYARHLGVLELSVTGETVAARNLDGLLVSVDDAIEFDGGIMAMIESFSAGIDAYLSTTGYAFDTPIFTTEIDIPASRDTQNPLGILVTSRIQAGLNGEIEEDVDLYFTGGAMIRNGIKRVGGEPTVYQFSDVFQLLPLGFSDGYGPGYDVVTMHISKWELLLMLELMETYARVNPIYRLAYSDALSFRVRGWGVPFVNRLADLTLNGKHFSDWPSLIKVGTNQHLIDNLSKINDVSFGLVEIVPKNAAGEPAAPVLETPHKEFVLFAKAMEGAVLSGSTH